MKFETFKACAMLLNNGGFPSDYATLGITTAEWDVFTGDTPWLHKDKAIVRKTYQAACEGVCTLASVPSIEVPAEYSAAIVATLVNPINHQIAANWFQVFYSQSAQTIFYAAQDQVDVRATKVSAKELFAMIILAYQDKGFGELAGAFRKKMNLAYAFWEHAVEQETQAPTA